MNNFILKAALNGKRSPTEHSAIPVRLEQIVDEAQQAVAAGADALHIHVRDRAGRESLQAVDVGRTLVAVRSACRGIPVGISTAAWIVGDADDRRVLIDQWEILPDFVSVNFDEAGVLPLVHLLRAKGIDIEAGLANRAAGDLLVQSRLASGCLRVLIEPDEQDLAAARATVRQIEAGLDQAGITLPRLLHGYQATTWPVLQDALRAGYATRIGFEDTLSLPNGMLAHSNAALVAAARQLIATTA